MTPCADAAATSDAPHDATPLGPAEEIGGLLDALAAGLGAHVAGEPWLDEESVVERALVATVERLLRQAPGIDVAALGAALRALARQAGHGGADRVGSRDAQGGGRFRPPLPHRRPG